MSTISQFLGAGPGSTFAKVAPSWTGSGRTTPRVTVGHSAPFKPTNITFPNAEIEGTYGAVYTGSGQQYMVNTGSKIYHVDISTSPETWTLRNPPVVPATNHANQLESFDGKIWCAGSTGAYYTSNNGVTWTIVPTAVSTRYVLAKVGTKLYITTQSNTSSSIIMDAGLSYVTRSYTNIGATYRVFGTNTLQIIITANGIYTSNDHLATAPTQSSALTKWLEQNGRFQAAGMLPNGTGMILTGNGTIGIINMSNGTISVGAKIPYIGDMDARQEFTYSRPCSSSFLSYVDADGYTHFPFYFIETIGVDNSGAYGARSYSDIARCFWCTTLDGMTISAVECGNTSALAPPTSQFLFSDIVKMGTNVLRGMNTPETQTVFSGILAPNLDSKEVYYAV